MPQYSYDNFTRLASLIFNVFIFAQIFNLINSRRINDEYNVFEGLFTSYLFLIILCIIIVCQVHARQQDPGRAHAALRCAAPCHASGARRVHPCTRFC